MVLAGLLMLVGLTWLAGPGDTGYLDPDAAEPGGSAALASLLSEEGVTIRRSLTTEAVAAGAAGGTVLVTDPSLIGRSAATRVVGAAPRRVVLTGASPADLEAWPTPFGDLQLGDAETSEVSAPACGLREADRAGPVSFPGPAYLDAPATAQACYPVATDTDLQDPQSRPPGHRLVVYPASAGVPELVLLSSGAPLTNEYLADAGNAALAMNLLGHSEDLVWWLPSPTDPALTGDESPLDLLPDWVTLAWLQAMVAAAALAWWRGRRLGKVVTEPLPVVVAAAETTLGRARLLQTAGARGTAADHLRRHTLDMLCAAVGIAPAAPPEQIVAAVADRCATPASTITDILYGPAPSSDRELVDLAERLRRLSEEVTHDD